MLRSNVAFSPQKAWTSSSCPWLRERLRIILPTIEWWRPRVARQAPRHAVDLQDLANRIALHIGVADLAVIEYPDLVNIVSGTLDYYVVLGEHSGCRQLVVPFRSPIQTIADLKEKKIGLPPHHDPVIWEFLARQAGVDPKSLHWVSVPLQLGGSAEELAFVKREFAAGRLDAYVTSDPVGEILIVDGVARRLASNTWTSPLSGWYCCMWAIRRDLLDQYPWLAKAVTRAVQQSAAFVERNPAEAVALSVAKGYMPRDTRQDLAARLLGEYVWTATGRIEEDLERYFQLLIEAGRLPASASPRELVQRVYRGTEA